MAYQKTYDTSKNSLGIHYHRCLRCEGEMLPATSFLCDRCIDEVCHEAAIDRAYDNHIPHSLITGIVIDGRKTTAGIGADYGYNEIEASQYHAERLFQAEALYV